MFLIFNFKASRGLSRCTRSGEESVGETQRKEFLRDPTPPDELRLDRKPMEEYDEEDRKSCCWEEDGVCGRGGKCGELCPPVVVVVEEDESGGGVGGPKKNTPLLLPSLLILPTVDEALVAE